MSPLTLFAEERPSLDVVESAPADRAGLHAERKLHAARPRGFVAPTLFEPSRSAPKSELDDVHESDDDDQRRLSTPVIVTAKTPEDYVVSRQKLLSVTHVEREACRADIERERA